MEDRVDSHLHTTASHVGGLWGLKYPVEKGLGPGQKPQSRHSSESRKPSANILDHLQ